MEKSESSDSDSNSSTSWVLVYDNTPPVEKANTFHLDCSREPIQELTEQDLLSAGSDLESDTDGVSVISESEAVHEELNEKVCDETSDLQDEDVIETLIGHIAPKKFDKSLVIEAKKLFTNTNIVGVGVFLTAVFLGSYTFIVQRSSVEETSDLQDFTVYDDSKIESNVLCKTDTSIDNQLEEIVDLTIACTYGGQDKNIAKHKEIKQCVKVQYETKKSVKEIPISDSLEKNHEAEALIDKVAEEVEKARSFQDDNKNQIMYIDEPIVHDEKPQEMSHNKTRKHKKDKSIEKPSKDKFKFKKGDSKKHSENKDRSKFEKYKRKHQIDAKNPKNMYKNKFENSKRSYEVKFKQNKFLVKKNNTSKHFEDANKSGEWYGNWHKARQELRKNDLMDERYLNKRKRMQWYFKWMDGREELRYKKSYRPYSS